MTQAVFDCFHNWQPHWEAVVPDSSATVQAGSVFQVTFMGMLLHSNLYVNLASSATSMTNVKSSQLLEEVCETWLEGGFA